MKKLLTILFAVALGLNLSAQVPESVVDDGLVGWWPFESNYDDYSGNENNCSVNGSVPFVQDRSGVLSSAVSFSGNGSNFLRVLYNQESFTFSEGISISVWVNSSSDSGDRRALQMGSTDGGGKGFHILKRSSHLGYKLAEGGANDPAFGLWSGSAAITPITLGEWHHIVFSVDFASLQWNTFLDGALAVTGASPFPFQENQLPLIFTQTFEIGRKMGTSNSGDAWSGFIDDIGIWNRDLTEEEILALYNSEPPTPGCTDSTACNFDSEATSDDGSCIPSGCMETDACNYNALAECEGEACDYTCCPGPGCCSAGMYWDYDLEQCLNYETCQEDLDGDGVIGINDLMELLSSFGTMCEELETVEFTCGDPMNYHGYDYATVQIGEQCWFAENLRTTVYANGDTIPAGLTDGEWTSTTAGATAVYGEASGYCENFSPEIDACDDLQSLEEYGRLYNWYAVDDARGLCPSVWHVPTYGEWTNLENYITSQGYAGTEGTALKSNYGWTEDFFGSNGTDDFGFSALPVGSRNAGEGYFYGAGSRGYWWSSSPNGDYANGDYAWLLMLQGNYSVMVWFNGFARFGQSIRCLKDSNP